jgi:hypothetical protein
MLVPQDHFFDALGEIFASHCLIIAVVYEGGLVTHLGELSFD